MIRIAALLVACAAIACVLEPDVLTDSRAQGEGTASSDDDDPTAGPGDDPCAAICSCTDSCTQYCDTASGAGCQFTCAEAADCDFG